MKGEIKLDDTQFRKAMRQYSYWTSKSLLDAVNGKARDLAFTAASRQKFASRGDILNVVENPRFVSWFCNEKYGKGGWDRDDWQREYKRVRANRLRSIKYLRSGYTKAGHKFPQTAASKAIAKSVLRHTGSTARAVTATASHLLASMDIDWVDPGSKYAKQSKEEVLLQALQSAIHIVTADMLKYIDRKQKALVKKYSA